MWKILELFRDGHSLASVIYSYEDELHITAKSDQVLLEILADWDINPDYGYIIRLSMNTIIVLLAVIMAEKCLNV